MASLLLLNHDLILKQDRVILVITFVGVICTIINSILINIYLGPYDKQEDIDTQNWKRKVILCLSTFNGILLAGSLLYDPKWYKILTAASLFLILTYLSERTEEPYISPHIWKRKAILVQSWVALVNIGLLLLLIVVRKKYIQK